MAPSDPIHGRFLLLISGSTIFEPLLGDWRAFKDTIRAKITQQPGWTDAWIDPGTGLVQGQCTIGMENDAEAIYEYYKSLGHDLRVSLFKLGPEGGFELMKCNYTVETQAQQYAPSANAQYYEAPWLYAPSAQYYQAPWLYAPSAQYYQASWPYTPSAQYYQAPWLYAPSANSQYHQGLYESSNHYQYPGLGVPSYGGSCYNPNQNDPYLDLNANARQAMIRAMETGGEPQFLVNDIEGRGIYIGPPNGSRVLFGQCLDLKAKKAMSRAMQRGPQFLCDVRGHGIYIGLPNGLKVPYGSLGQVHLQ